MCTLLIAWQVDPQWPIVVVANRDELRARAADPPLELHASPTILGGRDRLAGGTWLAVDVEQGRVGAVTNRHPRNAVVSRDPNRKSRGELPIDVLLAGDDAAAHDYLGQLKPTDYNPVNIVYLSRTAAYALSLDDEGGARLSELAPGFHALTLFDVDDSSSPKDQHLLSEMQTLLPDRHEVMTRFEAMVRDHTSPLEIATCLHTDPYGTVSSSTVEISAAGDVHYRYAGGLPCQVPYVAIATS